ncbi:unnamed protein product, partial [Closterium sp. Naga37s-1]
TFPPAPSPLHLPPCTFPLAPSPLHLLTCTFSPAPSHLHLLTCTFYLHPDSAHLPVSFCGSLRVSPLPARLAGEAEAKCKYSSYLELGPATVEPCAFGEHPLKYPPYCPFILAFPVIRVICVIYQAGEAEAKRKYSSYLELDLATVEPCGFAIPKAQQDKAVKVALKEGVESELVHGSVAIIAAITSCTNTSNPSLCLCLSCLNFPGFAIPKAQQDKAVKVALKEGVESELKHGSVVIAAITSCTNTSNPSVMLAAAIVAKKASERGLQVKPYVKTSLAPGSNVVTKYLEASGLLPALEGQGFHVVGYGCTTCIGNSTILWTLLLLILISPYLCAVVSSQLWRGRASTWWAMAAPRALTHNPPLPLPAFPPLPSLLCSGLLPALEGQGFHVVAMAAPRALTHNPPLPLPAFPPLPSLLCSGLLPALEGQGFHVLWRARASTWWAMAAPRASGTHASPFPFLSFPPLSCVFSGLLPALEGQGFHVVGYGCTTCIGNSGEIHEAVGQAIADNAYPDNATCIGNSGEIHEAVGQAIADNDLVAAAVLSSNHDVGGCAHPLTQAYPPSFSLRCFPLLFPSISPTNQQTLSQLRCCPVTVTSRAVCIRSPRANYLASPPLVVAYALAGTVDIDFETEPIGTDKGVDIDFETEPIGTDKDGKEVDIDFESEPIGTDKDGKEVDIDFETEPIGTDKDGKEVFLRDIWPSNEEVAEVVERAVLPQFFQSVYKAVKEGATNALSNSSPPLSSPSSPL